jgi:peptidoglycan/LPS O-acetylase OafA/YrhL
MKDNSINTLRGLACILLVAYHVIGGTPEQGLHIASGFLRVGNDVLAYIRMPLFTFLSGYIYSLKPIGNYSSSLFLKSKARRLLIVKSRQIVNSFFK